MEGNIYPVNKMKSGELNVPYLILFFHLSYLMEVLNRQASNLLEDPVSLTALLTEISYAFRPCLLYCLDCEKNR